MSHYGPLIVITGPESSGKTTLARQLAEAVRLPLVSEVAREILEARPPGYSESDVYRMALSQWQAQESVRQVHPIALADTDLLTYRIWLEERYNRCSDWVAALHRRTRPVHYLLCSPDLSWTFDPLRENPHNRHHLLDRHIRILRDEGMSFDLIRGQGEARLQLALSCLRYLGI